MRAYEIHALEPSTNTMVTAMIETEGTPSQIEAEIRKGGMEPVRVLLLDPKQADMYRRLGQLARRRNEMGVLLDGPLTVRHRRKLEGQTART